MLEGFENLQFSLCKIWVVMKEIKYPEPIALILLEDSKAEVLNYEITMGHKHLRMIELFIDHSQGNRPSVPGFHHPYRKKFLPYI